MTGKKVERWLARQPWTSKELSFLKKLNAPEKIQEYLDEIPYNPQYTCRSPRFVMIHGTAHCFEGALFAAAAIRLLGHPPLLVDLRAQKGKDDDHVIAVFRENGGHGAIAKSNFTVLRFREPVYRSLRELVMSYFDMYYNSLGEKTLRSYSRPLNLSRFDNRNWMTTEDSLEWIGDHLDAMPHIPVITRAMERSLRRVQKPLFDAGLLGAQREGLFKV